MPIPSEQNPAPKAQAARWTATHDRPHRSVFGNYRPSATEPAHVQCELNSNEPPDAATDLDPQGLQRSIDLAMARAFLYQFLARAFDDPALETWAWLTDSSTQTAVQSAAALLNSTGEPRLSAPPLLAALQTENFEAFQLAHINTFGHAARGICPLNEIEYGDLKADALIQPHRLADLAGFYNAFGLEIAETAAERHDHIGMELEFMAVLAAKQAYALEHQLDSAELDMCQQAQKSFLREHLGGWAFSFTRRVTQVATNKTFCALAEFTRAFLVAECSRSAVTPGREDLFLRPIDEAAESLCGSCGLKDLPPGAQPIETNS